MRVVLRIASDEGTAVDWALEDGDATFAGALEVIRRVMSQTTISAFEYEDEEGDRITVRSEAEMQAMMSYYLNLVQEAYSNQRHADPLVIYPRVGKSSRKRNVDGLKVRTKSDSSTYESPPSSMEHSGGSTKQEPQDLGQILSCGDIHESELRFLSILGSGNCGTVHRAIHEPTQRIMAVKVIPLDITAETQKKIITELEVLYKCKSSVIISFYGAFFVENKISICTEYMDGGSLDIYGQIPEHILGRMAVSVVHGLQYLWSLKIMHRDIKPSNILVNTQGQVKLCDFGVSVQLVNSIASTYVGTNAYMAPERIRAEDYGNLSEVWSLGLTLFEMAIGKFPYECDKISQDQPMMLLNHIVKMAPKLPHGMFSRVFECFVTSCLQMDPSARPSPASLMHHPFITKYNDGNIIVVAHWVLTKLQEIRNQQTAKAASC